MVTQLLACYSGWNKLLYPGDNKKLDCELEPMSAACDYTHSRLKNLDPVAANRIHPNDHRKPKPRIDYTLMKAIGGSLTALPGLSDMIDDTVKVSKKKKRQEREAQRQY